MQYQRTSVICLCFLLTFSVQAQKKYTVLSPDKTIELNVSVADSISYNVFLDKKELVGRSVISFKTDANKGNNWKVSKAKQSFMNELLYPVILQKSASVKNIYNQLRIDFANGLSLVWRAFDNGVAWQWVTNNTGSYKVVSEQAVFSFDPNGRAWYPQEEQFFSHNERQYRNYLLDSIDDKKLASLPALFDLNGTKVLLTESSLFNYAGMWLRGKGAGQIQAVFPNYPKTKRVTSDRDEQVLSREGFIANINGPQAFPWRILMIARTDKEI